MVKSVIDLIHKGQNITRKIPEVASSHCRYRATLNTVSNYSNSHGISLLLFTGNIPTEGRTVDGRERETESVTRTEDKKIQDWSKGERRSRGFALVGRCGEVDKG